MRKLHLAVYSFAVIGFLCIGLGLFWLITTILFLRHAHYATGTVIENVARQESHTEDGKTEESTYYYPRVRFQTSSGQTIVFLLNTGSDPPTYQPNDKVTVLYDLNNPSSAKLKDWSLWFGPGMFIGLGSVAVCFGLIPVFMAARKKRLTHHLLDKGVLIAADFTSIDRIEPDVEGQSKPWVIVCQWLNPETGKMYVFKSDAISFDPTAYVKRDKINVRLDPERPDQYEVDTSFLPGLAEKTPFSWSGWRKKKTDALRDKWREVTDHSLDAILAVFYWFCMIGLLAMRGALPERRQLLLAAILILGILILALWQRQSAGWVWPGFKDDMLRSLLVLAAIAIVVVLAFLWIAPVSRPANLPWYLAAFGLLAFNALQTTGLLSRKRSEFRQACTAPVSPLRPPARIAAIAYKAFFFVAWLAAIAYLVLPGALQWLRQQSTEHAHVPAPQTPELHWLRTVLLFALGLLIVFACVLDFGMKIPLVPRPRRPRRTKPRRPPTPRRRLSVC